MMGLENCAWSAIDVMNVVDDAELVTIVRDIYLCVWYGGGEVEIYDVTDPACLPDVVPLRYAAPRSLQSAHEAIDEFFIQLDVDFEDNCLTTPLWGVIVNTESDDTTEDN
jgi:hypothetical protein